MYLHSSMEIAASAGCENHIFNVGHFFRFVEYQWLIRHSHQDMMLAACGEEGMIDWIMPVHHIRKIDNRLFPDYIICTAYIHKRSFIHEFSRMNVSLKYDFSMRD